MVAGGGPSLGVRSAPARRPPSVAVQAGSGGSRSTHHLILRSLPFMYTILPYSRPGCFAFHLFPFVAVAILSYIFFPPIRTWIIIYVCHGKIRTAAINSGGPNFPTIDSPPSDSFNLKHRMVSGLVSPLKLPLSEPPFRCGKVSCLILRGETHRGHQTTVIHPASHFRVLQIK